MIFHDSVRVAMQVSLDPPQYDEYGDEIMDHIEATVPAEVFPLDTDAVLRQGTTIVISRYRILLAPQVDIPPKISNMLRIGWGAFGLNPENPFSVTSGLQADGTVERHMMRGRLHHYELITKNVMA